eukprot:190728-Amphidinium_carterae.3
MVCLTPDCCSNAGPSGTTALHRASAPSKSSTLRSRLPRRDVHNITGFKRSAHSFGNQEV